MCKLEISSNEKASEENTSKMNFTVHQKCHVYANKYKQWSSLLNAKCKMYFKLCGTCLPLAMDFTPTHLYIMKVLGCNNLS